MPLLPRPGAGGLCAGTCTALPGAWYQLLEAFGRLLFGESVQLTVPGAAGRGAVQGSGVGGLPVSTPHPHQ